MRSCKRTNRPLVPLAVCFVGLLALLESSGLILHPEVPQDLRPLIGKRAAFQARVVRPPEPHPAGQRVVVEAGGARVLVTISTLARAREDQEIQWLPLSVGDRVLLEARLKRPARYLNPGGFDYRRLLGREGIVLTAFVSDPSRLKRLDEGQGSDGWITLLRRQISGAIFERIAPPASGLLAALFLGDRSQVSDALWEKFRVTGTAHLLAISGQHIAIVAVSFYALFLWVLKRSTRLILLFSIRKVAATAALVPVWLYVLIAGAPPSALRAGIGVTLGALALWLRREVEPYSALAAAAILVALIDPSSPFTASYQLSFLAVLGILIFRSRGWSDRVPRWLQTILVKPFLLSFGALMGTAPLVAYRFQILALSGLWNNLWAVPACGILLIVGPLLLLLRQDSLLEGATRLFLIGIDQASRTSFSWPVYPTGWEMLVAYLFIGLAALLYHRRIRPVTGLAIAALVSLGLFSWSSLLPRRLEVTFLDVGQGDAALVVAPTGRAMLIDGGGFLIPGGGRPAFDVGERVLLPYLGRRGIKRLDRVVLSHPHPDHYGGLQAVLSSLDVGELWWNGQRFPDPTFDSLLEALPPRKMRIVKAGDQAVWEGVKIDVLYPPSVERHRSINDNSLVLRLSYGGTSFLFPGDIEREGERFLSALESSPGATVVKVPHHASRTSSSIAFVDRTAPRFAVASLGESNPFGFPHRDVLERYERRGVQVFRTDRDGAVTFVTDGREMRVSGSRGFPTRQPATRTSSSAPGRARGGRARPPRGR